MDHHKQADDVEMLNVEMLVKEIGSILHGKGPAVQGAVLADLFAMLLAGHQGTKPAIDKYREQFIGDWLETVRKLVPVNEKMILELSPEPSPSK
jgi:hypothetical protein